jgi:hypothetical protein
MRSSPFLFYSLRSFEFARLGDNVARKGKCLDYIQSSSNRDLQGVATRDDIDKTLRLGMNHPMGPLQLGKPFPLHFPRPFLTLHFVS